MTPPHLTMNNGRTKNLDWRSVSLDSQYYAIILVVENDTECGMSTEQCCQMLRCGLGDQTQTWSNIVNAVVYMLGLVDVYSLFNETGTGWINVKIMIPTVDIERQPCTTVAFP